MYYSLGNQIKSNYITPWEIKLKIMVLFLGKFITKFGVLE